MTMLTAVGWTLLHSLWQGALVAAALGIALLCTRDARVRYAGGCGALAAILLAFGLTLIHLMPGGGDAIEGGTARELGAWIGRPLFSPPVTWDQRLEMAAPWLARFWMLGICVFCFRNVAALVSAGSLRRRGVCRASAEWQKQVARLGAQLRVLRPVVLLESCFTDTPMVIGHWRPVILTPVGMLTGVPAAQIEAILMHELVHVRRHDYLINVLQRAVEGLLFYHPAVWWISGVIRAERENCCDDAVVAITGDRYHYAEALAALEVSRGSDREPALAATGGSLMKRIHRVLYPKTAGNAWTTVVAALALVVTAALTLSAWQSDGYTKWLNQDVVYIIEPVERAAFQSLKTDEERDHFIEQFWERRTPAFQKEHYRRIAYANQHFQGWENDRAHVYIVNGPPDEIESHPGKFEDWRYYRIGPNGGNRDYRFIDRSGKGDYHLVAPGAAE